MQEGLVSSTRTDQRSTQGVPISFTSLEVSIPKARKAKNITAGYMDRPERTLTSGRSSFYILGPSTWLLVWCVVLSVRALITEPQTKLRWKIQNLQQCPISREPDGLQPRGDPRSRLKKVGATKAETNSRKYQKQKDRGS